MNTRVRFSGVLVEFLPGVCRGKPDRKGPGVFRGFAGGDWSKSMGLNSDLRFSIEFEAPRLPPNAGSNVPEVS